MKIDEFLEKHAMPPYRLGKITGIDRGMITKYRSGKTPLGFAWRLPV
jgi:hypothetical protein